MTSKEERPLCSAEGTLIAGHPGGAGDLYAAFLSTWSADEVLDGLRTPE